MGAGQALARTSDSNGSVVTMATLMDAGSSALIEVVAANTGSPQLSASVNITLQLKDISGE